MQNNFHQHLIALIIRQIVLQIGGSTLKTTQITTIMVHPSLGQISSIMSPKAAIYIIFKQDYAHIVHFHAQIHYYATNYYQIHFLHTICQLYFMKPHFTIFQWLFTKGITKNRNILQYQPIQHLYSTYFIKITHLIADFTQNITLFMRYQGSITLFSPIVYQPTLQAQQ